MAFRMLIASCVLGRIRRTVALLGDVGAGAALAEVMDEVAMAEWELQELFRGLGASCLGVWFWMVAFWITLDASGVGGRLRLQIFACPAGQPRVRFLAVVPAPRADAECTSLSGSRTTSR
mmetsp:Transcript_8820/g.31340  ORF Transcript_8820/g.31340 Transcript_8820/m.31340 type:complete len:120 (+) Transcript_8820:1249-1608(+)